VADDYVAVNVQTEKNSTQLGSQLRLFHEAPIF
jgi:hypothetical protein